MKIAKLLAFLGLLAMTAVLIYGFALGSFVEEGKQLLSMPWGIVSLVDLYVGFVLFSGWIIYRERSAARSAIWVVLMMVLGFWTGSLYTLIALQTSDGDWRRFWLGRRLDDG
jgi:ABC-type polysaccharide/polyol phosphate export permease